MKVKPIDEIRNFLEPIAERAGVEIIDVEFKQGKNPALTVFVDTESGVDLDTLERFHNLINAPLDELDPTFGAAYTLNVSSPGVDRPFRSDRDYERNLGRQVEVRLFAPIKGEKHFEGELLAFDDGSVTLRSGGGEVRIERNRIAKINQAVIFD